MKKSKLREIDYIVKVIQQSSVEVMFEAGFVEPPL